MAGKIRHFLEKLKKQRQTNKETEKKHKKNERNTGSTEFQLGFNFQLSTLNAVLLTVTGKMHFQLSLFHWLSTDFQLAFLSRFRVDFEKTNAVVQLCA